jgi:hypothetical protein
MQWQLRLDALPILQVYQCGRRFSELASARATSLSPLPWTNFRNRLSTRLVSLDPPNPLHGQDFVLWKPLHLAA